MSDYRHLPVVPRRIRSVLHRCPNCKALPVFRKSDDPEYKVLLVHASATCPATFGYVIYHHTQKLAAARWNDHAEQWKPHFEHEPRVATRSGRARTRSGRRGAVASVDFQRGRS